MPLPCLHLNHSWEECLWGIVTPYCSHGIHPLRIFNGQVEDIKRSRRATAQPHSIMLWLFLSQLGSLPKACCSAPQIPIIIQSWGFSFCSSISLGCASQSSAPMSQPLATSHWVQRFWGFSWLIRVAGVKGSWGNNFKCCVLKISCCVGTEWEQGACKGFFLGSKSVLKPNGKSSSWHEGGQWPVVSVLQQSTHSRDKLLPCPPTIWPWAAAAWFCLLLSVQGVWGPPLGIYFILLSYYFVLSYARSLVTLDTW